MVMDFCGDGGIIRPVKNNTLGRGDKLLGAPKFRFKWLQLALNYLMLELTALVFNMFPLISCCIPTIKIDKLIPEPFHFKIVNVLCKEGNVVVIRSMRKTTIFVDVLIACCP